jgi:hypothetical protein
LSWAAIRGDAVSTRALLEAGADLEVADQDGKTPLILAATGGDPTTVSLLLEQGADRQAKDNNGLTALDWAQKRKRTEIVKLLSAAPG